MKKTLLISALAAVMVFAFASSALAMGPAYVAWTSVGANATSLPTPHKDYQLATEKCSVCHSVHAARNGLTAQPGIAEALSGTDAQMLLRSDVANACNYCHITTAIGVKVVYNGNIALYETGAVNNSFGHDHGHASCTGCHSVHGANVVAGGAAGPIGLTVATKILKQQTYEPKLLTDKGLAAADVNVGTDVAGTGYLGNRQGYVSAFCSGCHPAYSDKSETAITQDLYWSPKYKVQNGVTFKNHPMKAVGGENVADGDQFTAAGASFTNKAVAFAGTEYCRSCHTAGTDGATNNVGTIPTSFPHNTPNAANFLNSGVDINAAAAGATDAGEDGVCLRCHVNGVNGVGKSF